MKKILLVSMTLMALMLMACGSNKSAVDPVQAQAVQALLEMRQFVVMVGSMRPLSAPTVSVSQGQKIIVRDGTVSCYLPYVGSACSLHRYSKEYALSV